MLTSYKGQTITYDNIGNPLVYRDGFSFSWSSGRKLTTVNLNNGSVYMTGEYRYDDNGIRTYKEVNGNVTRYYLNGSTILTEETNYGGVTRRIDYIYDENGSIYGFYVDGMAHYYQKNLQGDITGILDANGNLLVEYIYDAYGVPTTIYTGITHLLTDAEKQEIYILGSNNPFRYRGYYYDTETGFYYLNSRYYDPQTGRFLNADGYASTGQGVLGQNMFAYCGNNPISRADTSGQFWGLVIAIAKVAVRIACVVAVANKVNNLRYAEKNYGENSLIDANPDPNISTKNRELNDQNGTTGEKFTYGEHPASKNACETIAVHNAKFLLGKESTLSETMRDFQLANAMIGDGFFGSNPLAIGRVLRREGIAYSRVGLSDMTQSGVYIFSYWNKNPLKKGLHTIAVCYDGSTYTAYNLKGDGDTHPIFLSDYKNTYICGYYLR